MILRPLWGAAFLREYLGPAYSSDLMKKAYWIDGRLLTERDLQDIRRQLEGFDRVTAISDEMRDVIGTEWPDLAAKLLRRRTLCRSERPPA
jgi:hypothetical protein